MIEGPIHYFFTTVEEEEIVDAFSQVLWEVGNNTEIE